MGSRQTSTTLIILTAVIGCVFLFAPSALAQVDTGAVHGTITDPDGGVIPGATVTLTNQDTGLSVSTTTGPEGTYSFSPVRIGKYKIDVELSGFGPATRSDIAVDVQQRALVNIGLQPGGVRETVEVTGAAPQLQTQDASVGMVATREQINNLPLNGRN
jgi:hypothetical protein